MKTIITSILIWVLCLWAASAQELENAELFVETYPRAMYFRIAEFDLRTEYSGKLNKYKEWRDRFSDLSGIMGKTEFEELLRDNPHEQIYQWFKRYKKDFPEKLVIVHLNGRGRIPNYKIDKFFPGHWLYFEGSDVFSNLPSENSLDFNKSIWIDVADGTRFRTDNGSKGRTKDDITLVRRKEDGTLDWENAEYVRLLEVQGNRIKIERAMFGSKGIKFNSGKTYAAPRVMGGPWGSTANMVWYYNLSTACPKDKNGKTCADILLEELAGNFAKGGRWQTFDGIEFDVMADNPTTGYHEPRRKLGERADTDGDGKQDDGIINDINEFGLGVYSFINRLRERIGPDKIIAADGRELGCQKVGNSVFNGVEMEGLPEQRPYGWATWSTVYNTLSIWKTISAKPDFNYAAFRYNNPDKLDQKTLFRYYRLGFALNAFTETFMAVNSWTALRGIPNIQEVFENPDIKKSSGWLGKPIGPPVYITSNKERYPDILQGTGSPVTIGLLDSTKQKPYFKFTNYSMEKDIIRISPSAERKNLEFRFFDVPYPNKQVYIEIKLRSVKENPKYPEGYNRMLQVLSVGNGQRYKIMLLPVTNEWNTYRIYFCDTYDPMLDMPVEFGRKGHDKLELLFRITDIIDPIEIASITVQNAPEVIYREFEKGHVLANLSAEPYYYEPLDVTLPSKDAIFLLKK